MSVPSIRIYGEALSRFNDVAQKEWIITNGLGGYASSTVLGMNTRKYHGLLVAALSPPGERTVCLTKLDEEVDIGNNAYPLFVNEFQNRIFPRGHLYLKEFSLSPTPKYVYEIQNFRVQKGIFMLYKKNAVVQFTISQTQVKIKLKCEFFQL